MKELKEIIEELDKRIDVKHEQYNALLDLFRFSVAHEPVNEYYEVNAIKNLVDMLKLSAEIRELDYVISALNSNVYAVMANARMESDKAEEKS